MKHYTRRPIIILAVSILAIFAAWQFCGNVAKPGGQVSTLKTPPPPEAASPDSTRTDSPVASTVSAPERNPAGTPSGEKKVNISSISATAPTGSGKTEAETVLAQMQDTRRPVEERQKDLTEISRRQDASALNILKAVGDAHVYLNHAAVEAIGNFAKSPEKPAAGAYLQGRLADPDSQIACAAIRAYGRLTGDASIPELAAALKGNRERPDGHQEIVCTAAVKALQDTGSAAAVPVLIAELERSEEKGWSLEYGSSVLAALRATRTPDGQKGAVAYADRLAARIPEDKLARAYFEEKIADAREAAVR